MKMKPNLSLYIDSSVVSVLRGDEEWQWALLLDNGVRIENRDRREVFRPELNDLIGSRIKTISLSVHDTTITFSNGEKWSLNPTQYVLADPRHGGEVWPQWPEELEEAGIPSHPDEGISDPPLPGWLREREKLVEQQQERIERQAKEFLEEDERDSQT